MNILITGGAGFIGSHLTEKLLAEGHHIVAVDDLSTGSLDNVAASMNHPKFQFVRESVRNESTMTALVDRCDAIYHLAAAVGVQLIVDRPVHTIETNIHGSEVVLNLANKFRRKILVRVGELATFANGRLVRNAVLAAIDKRTRGGF